jgi:hypothetical protein
LVNPSVNTVAGCGANLSEKSPVDCYNDCRWKTQNVLVENNALIFNLADVVRSGAVSCTISNLCGFNGLFSNYGSSIYGNTRVGVVTSSRTTSSGQCLQRTVELLRLEPEQPFDPVTCAEWTGPVTDQCSTSAEIASGNCFSGFGQDAGSTLR